MQAIEYKTPSQTVSLLAKEFKEIENKTRFIDILSLNLGPNNLASKKALKWITKSLEVFEEEIETSIYNHGDIGEAVYHFDNSDESSEYGLGPMYSILQMDCSKSDGEAFRIFNTYFNGMSSLERKWFLRYWLRTPRNGINEGLVRKLVAKVYDKKEAEVKKHMQLHSLSDIVVYYTTNQTPPNDLVIGRFIKPMLAKEVPKEKWPKESIIEYKYDGARYQIHKGDSVLIFNRKGKVVTDKFPDIVLMINAWEMKESFIIDTEIYPVNANGSPAPFQKMGTRIHSKDHEKAMLECPVKLAIFDVLHFEGETLTEMPLITRLEYLDKFEDRAIYAKDENYNSFYSRAIAEGFEGIMVKNLNALYCAGKRSVHWAKHKPPRIELDVVITGARYGEGKRGNVFASFDIAVLNEGEFENIGSIGTGFKDVDFTRLTNTLRPIVEDYDNGTYNVLPRIVLEVTSDLISVNNEGNYGLRFPRLVAIRDDKAVSEIDTIDDVVRMVQ